MDAMGQPSARSISALAGGRRLLAVLLLLLVMCSMHPAHAWGGGSGSGGGIGTKTNRKDPRLVFKKPGSTLQVVPGQQFTVSIRVKKARLRQPALFQVVLPDGALFVGPTGHQPKQTTKKGDIKGRTPAPTAETAWKAKRAAAKRFPPPDTVARHRRQRHGGRADAAVAPGRLPAPAEPHQAGVRGGLLRPAFPTRPALRLAAERPVGAAHRPFGKSGAGISPPSSCTTHALISSPMTHIIIKPTHPHTAPSVALDQRPGRA